MNVNLINPAGTGGSPHCRRGRLW